VCQAQSNAQKEHESKPRRLPPLFTTQEGNDEPKKEKNHEEHEEHEGGYGHSGRESAHRQFRSLTDERTEPQSHGETQEPDGDVDRQVPISIEA
jgi:hypothetical protein